MLFFMIFPRGLFARHVFFFSRGSLLPIAPFSSALCGYSQNEREEPALPLLFPPDDNRTALRAHPLFGFVLYIIPKYDAVFIRLFDHSQGF